MKKLLQGLFLLFLVVATTSESTVSLKELLSDVLQTAHRYATNEVADGEEINDKFIRNVKSGAEHPLRKKKPEIPLIKVKIQNPKSYGDGTGREAWIYYNAFPDFSDEQQFTNLNIMFVLGFKRWKSTFKPPLHMECNMDHKNRKERCVAQVQPDVENLLLGSVSMRMNGGDFAEKNETTHSEAFFRRLAYQLFEEKIPVPKKSGLAKSSSQVKSRSLSLAKSTTTEALDIDIETIRNVAPILSRKIYGISPYWFTYNYDDSTYPIDSIIDGGNDMFDRGNQIKVYEDSEEPTEYLQYNNISKFKNFDVVTGGSFFPFLTFAWIRNDDSESHTYTMKVSGNLGADGEGVKEHLEGELTIQQTFSIRYHVFQVYGTPDPPVCEVYFAVTNQSWESAPGDFSATFSEETDDVTNSVTLSGQSQNVLMGYALLSVMNVTKVQQDDIDLIFHELVDSLNEDGEVSESCGGTYTLFNETGDITIVSPRFYYDSYRYCTYSIQAASGSRIEVILTYQQMNDYLRIRDGFTGSYQMRGSSQPVIWTSRSESITLTYNQYFYGYPFYQFSSGSTGFFASVRQFVPTCGFSGSLNSTEATLTSPSFPNGYSSASDCVWVITGTWNRLYSISVNHLQLSGDDDFLVINSGGTFHHFNKGDSSISSFYLGERNGISVHYHAGAHAADAGFNVTIGLVSCDETYHLNDTPSRSMKLPLYSSSDYISQGCSYTFRPQTGYIVEVIVKFERNITAGYYNDFRLNVNDGLSYHGNVYSSINETTLTSNENYLQISYNAHTYHSENVTLTYRQFQANCGFNISNTTSAIIQSPSYPNENSEVEECFWILRHPSTNLLQLELDALTLQTGSGYLEVTDGFTRIEKYEQSLTAPTKLIATSGIMRIRYHALASAGASGFKGTYGEGTCDRNLTISDGSTATITPDQRVYRNYWYYKQCTTTITAQSDHRVELIVEFASYVYSSRSIEILNGNTSTRTSSYNGNQQFFISSGPTIKIRYDYITYDYGYGSITFSLTYRQVQTNCGQTISSQSSSQSLVSSNYPGNYENDQECYWTIHSDSDRSTKLTVHELTVHSKQDYLDVVAGDHKLIRYDESISDPINFISNTGGDIVVRFTTDSSGVQKGFNSTYQEVMCGATFHMTDYADIYYPGSTYTNIPNIPYHFWTQNNNESLHFTCEYFFTAEEGNKVQLQTNSYYSSACCWYVEVFDGNTKIGNQDSNVPNAFYISNERTLKLVYHNNGASNIYGSTVLYAYASQYVPQCGHARTADSTLQTIMTPGYPNVYQHNTKCLWMITIPDQQVLNVTIVFLDLADGDNLEISDGGRTQTRYSGLISTPVSLILDTPSVRIQFISIFSNSLYLRKGFKATYTLGQNPCSSEPCQNSGTCLINDGTFRCLCSERFTGSTCETNVSPCDENPCLNGGTCIDSLTTWHFTCNCADGFAGEFCFGVVNECFPNNPCADHANCTDMEIGYNCTCVDGYRGDGRTKCYKIILLPYGTDVGDTLLDVKDDATSERMWIDYEVSMGSTSFSTFRVTSNGLITLGWADYFSRSLNHPPANGFDDRKALIAPFWDNFHPDPSNEGRVYYQMYDKTKHSVDSAGTSLFEEVQKRIRDKFNTKDFAPTFILKATWHNVVMYPGDNSQHQKFPSTFQAILTSDGCDSYLLYLYKEDAMLWEKGLRSSDHVLIGFTNGGDLSYKESQGDYRPDQRVQKSNGLNKSEYIYKLTEFKTNKQVARCGCLKWYLEDVQTEWIPNRTPCPCSNFQASEDPRFVRSVDHNLEVNENRNGSYRTADISEWRHYSGQCYQLRNGTGPRCCYFQRRSFWTNWWWGWWWFRGGLVRGSLGSRYERYQIPMVDSNGLVDTRNEELFQQQYEDALHGDLIPRRQCCIESGWRYCRMYRQRRPDATCWGYVWRGRVITWGDPHFTTIDGASYTFNGLGEFHLVKADEIFSLQARTARVKKADGSLTDATAFVAFVAQDHHGASGKVQFEVDYSDSSGTGVLVKVDNNLQTLSGSEIMVESVALSVTNGSYQAVFPSQHSVSVSASSFLLTVQFSGDPSLLGNVSKGLLGYWSGNKEDDFELRDGTTLVYEDLKVTENLDILNGTLSEGDLYAFGRSWQVLESESLFTYSGGSDMYSDHNPTDPSVPPFLEELVASQRNTDLFNTILKNCTTDGSISTTCLYDTLTTNDTQIGQTTLGVGAAFAVAKAIGANTPPTPTVDGASISFVDGYFQVSLNTMSTLTVSATDVDGDDVTFALAASNTILNVTIDSDTGVVTWLPTEEHLALDLGSISLDIVASDDNEGEGLLTIPIKLCRCPPANGNCSFDSTESGSDNFQIVNCECTEAWSGDDCSEDRNACPSACYTGVDCFDREAPLVGEECGPCPAGTTGNGRNCTTIDLCDPNPCQHECTPFFNGFNCSCMEGYLINDESNTLCDDINECEVNNPCDKINNSTCLNTDGSYRCNCGEGMVEILNRCEDQNECTLGTHNCSQKTSSCQNQVGTYTCLCRHGYKQNNGNSTCENIDECAESTMNECAVNATCTDSDGSYGCICQEGYEGDGKICERASIGGSCDGVECPEGQACDDTSFKCTESGSGSTMFEKSRVYIFLQLFSVCCFVFMTA